jgi:hypothetical protein
VPEADRGLLQCGSLTKSRTYAVGELSEVRLMHQVFSVRWVTLIVTLSVTTVTRSELRWEQCFHSRENLFHESDALQVAATRRLASITSVTPA